MTFFSKLTQKELPHPPPWTKALGVGVVIMGMAMGTGELILWPHLITKFGLPILWFALVGITLQYFINQEVIRHTLATGESFFTTSARVLFWSPIFWLVAALLLYIWPGWASTLGTILAELFGFGSYVMWAWASLVLVLILTFSGRRAYEMLEGTLKIIVPLFALLLVWISVLNLSWSDVVLAIRGLVNFGYMPKGIDVNVLLGAIVFAGAGGMLNLCTSLWYRDKQAGMAAYNGRIENPVSGKPEAVGVVGATFDTTQPEQMVRWRKWMRFVRIDQGAIFWGLGTLTLVLLSANAYVVLSPLGIVPEGTRLAIEQAHIFGSRFGNLGSTLYLVMTYLMLFSVMWTVIDALTRIVGDIVHTNAREGALKRLFAPLARLSIHHLYYGLVIVVIVVQAILLPFNQPLTFLVTSSALGGIVMALYSPLLLYLNNTKLPKALRPSWFTNIVLIGASLFYLYFAIVVIRNFFS
jgi:hypothetical protein